MPKPSRSILVLNGGSSSIRFALPRAIDELTRACSATMERIGRDDAHLAIDDVAPAEARHGVVHGMCHFDPERITPDLLAGLRRFEAQGLRPTGCPAPCSCCPATSTARRSAASLPRSAASTRSSSPRGIGESAPATRARICGAPRNADAPGLISSPTGRVAVHVTRTNEAHVVARAVRDLLALDAARHESPR